MEETCRLREVNLVEAENPSLEGMIGHVSSSGDDTGVLVSLGNVAAVDILGVREIRGVTGVWQSNAGDDKKDVVVPVFKLSPKNLGRSILNWNTCSYGALNVLNSQYLLRC